MEFLFIEIGRLKDNRFLCTEGKRIVESRNVKFEMSIRHHSEDEKDVVEI